MQTKFYLIQCLTDLHMGDGGDNYAVVDNEVAKDEITGYPIMPSSGIKGAMREFVSLEQRGTAMLDKEKIETLFGSELKSGDAKQQNNEAKQQGALRFLSARMLARPVRASKGEMPYYMTTTKTALAECVLLTDSLAKGASLCTLEDGFYGQEEQVEVEGYAVKKAGALPDFYQKIKLCSLAVVPDEQFAQMPLPVTAHNQLEDGQSKHLWYDEDVPARSLFLMAVQGEADHLQLLDGQIANKAIQFGANASTGKGLCLVTPLEV